MLASPPTSKQPGMRNRSPGKVAGDNRMNFAAVSGVVFRAKNFFAWGLTISGVTKDSTGTPLPGVTVNLFVTATNEFVQTTVSDGGGNYTFNMTGSKLHFAEAYYVSTPDLAGTTVNTLVGTNGI